MMTDLQEADYSKLTEKELKILIYANDLSALEEFNKRVKEGKIKLNKYSCDETGDLIAMGLKAELNLTHDYKKLTNRELHILMRIDDSRAQDEHDRRTMTGEIKTRRITFEEIRQMYSKENKAS